MIPGNTDGDGSIAVGIDIGGTFTDIVCRDAAGHVRQMKIPSDRARPAEAVLAALSRMQAEWAVAPDEISQLVHGTTVATNAVLERKGAKVGIITTKGFRDVLEIGRQGREQIYDTVLKPQTPVFLAPRRQRQEVDERVARDGTILTPLDEGDVRRAADQLVAEGCNAIAIAFLFCFSNPAHEIRAAEIIKEAYPEIDISRSSIVDPTFREYERTCAT
ncbi:MAG: hydantoinase/oxoprolinase N-terminal domain-containing protein, partial [Pseudomonadota bacterium]